jgi:hypothetical protein
MCATLFRLRLFVRLSPSNGAIRMLCAEQVFNDAGQKSYKSLLVANRENVKVVQELI